MNPETIREYHVTFLCKYPSDKRLCGDGAR